MAENDSTTPGDPPQALPDTEAVEPPKSVVAEPAPPSRRSRGFLGGLVGGALVTAVALGTYWATTPWDTGPDLTPLTSGLEEQAGRAEAMAAEIAALKTEIEGLKAAPVAGDGIEARLGTLEAELSTRIDEAAGDIERLSSTMSLLEGRIAQVEARPPVFEGDASEATGELVAQMRAALEAQRAEIATLADDARARLEAVEAEAAAMQERSAAQAREATLRGAKARLLAALDAGEPFAAPLGELAEVTGAAVPEALGAAAAEGVATLAELRESFPEAARAVLAATSQEALPEDAGMFDRFGAFLKAQTGARSLEPQEGTDPDALLSRAEAALAEGRLDDALALVGGLPPLGLDAMAEWRGRAEARAAAVAAAAVFGAE